MQLILPTTIAMARNQGLFRENTTIDCERVYFTWAATASARPRRLGNVYVAKTGADNALDTCWLNRSHASLVSPSLPCNTVAVWGIGENLVGIDRAWQYQSNEKWDWSYETDSVAQFATDGNCTTLVFLVCSSRHRPTPDVPYSTTPGPPLPDPPRS